MARAIAQTSGLNSRGGLHRSTKRGSSYLVAAVEFTTG